MLSAAAAQHLRIILSFSSRLGLEHNQTPYASRSQINGRTNSSLTAMLGVSFHARRFCLLAATLALLRFSAGIPMGRCCAAPFQPRRERGDPRFLNEHYGQFFFLPPLYSLYL